MRSLLCGVVVGLALSASSYGDEQTSKPSLRQLGKPAGWEFEGVDSFDPDEIRSALGKNFGLQIAAQGGIPIAEFLERLADVIRQGYRNSGFPDAEINATYEETVRGIVVRVNEGPRFRNGPLDISGARMLSAEVLRKCLTEPYPSKIGVPMMAAKATGEPLTIWVNGAGTAIKMSETIWKADESTSFHDDLATRASKQLLQEYRSHGYHFPIIRCQIFRDDASQSGTLRVSVLDEGPPSTVGKIEIKGHHRHSRKEILRFLDLQPGAPYDSQLGTRLERRLRGSGRFLRASVTTVDPEARKSAEKRGVFASVANAFSPSHDTGIVTISVQEASKGPTLTDALTAPQQALLKAAEWIEEWSHGNEPVDLVIDLTFDPPKKVGANSASGKSATKAGLETLPKVALKLILSPSDGQLFDLTLKNADATSATNHLMAICGNRCLAYSPQRRLCFDALLPELVHPTLAVTIEGDANQTRGKSSDDFKCGLSAGVRTQRATDQDAISVSAQVAPVTLLSLQQLPEWKSVIRDGRLVSSSKDLQLVLDISTGRLLEFKWADAEIGLRLAVQTRPGAMKSSFAELATAAASSRNAYRPAMPVHSLIEYLLGEMHMAAKVATSAENQATLAALRKLVHHMSVISSSRHLEELARNETLSFRLPPDAAWGNVNITRVGSNDWTDLFGKEKPSDETVGMLLALYRDLVPTFGSLSLMGELMAISASGHLEPEAVFVKQLNMALLQYYGTGPVGDLLVATIANGTNRKSFANMGLAELTTAAFRLDYVPLLSGEGLLSQMLLATADGARHLNEPEIHSLVRLLPVDSRPAVADCLIQLAREPERPLVEALPGALDELWESYLQDKVRLGLIGLGGKPDKSQVKMLRDRKVQPASAGMPAEATGNRKKK